MQAHVDAAHKALADCIALDKAWRQGKLQEWVTQNLEAERKAFYGDSGNSDDGGTDPESDG